MPTPLTDGDKVLRNDTGIDIATNIASIASALTPSNITDLGDVNLTNPITDGQVIKYDTATQKWVNGLGNITMECTQAQYDAWKQSGQLKTNTLYVITDAPNLNATAQDISYDGGADSVWDKVESKVANVAFDSSTMFADISTAVKNAFNLSECYCYVLKNGNVCTVTLRFKCANAIASGSFNITGLTPCQTDVASALASLDNKGGYMQLSGTVLYIRCAASSSQYLAGSITYPTYTN